MEKIEKWNGRDIEISISENHYCVICCATLKYENTCITGSVCQYEPDLVSSEFIINEAIKKLEDNIKNVANGIDVEKYERYLKKRKEDQVTAQWLVNKFLK